MCKSIRLFGLYLLAGMLFAACEQKPAVRFAVVSDPHFGHKEAVSKVSRSLKVLFSKQPLVDAVFVVGDLTDNGKTAQYEQLAAVFNDPSIVPAGVAVYLMLGNNHDKTREGGAEIFMEKTGQPMRHYVDIKGYPFVAFGEGGSHENEFNADVRQWLAETMADAATKYPGKPIFAFSHVPPANTCYGSLDSEGWGTHLFLPVYNLYPQAIVFGGHSHYPVGDPRSIHQGIFTSINDGSIYYSELAPGEVSGGIHPPGHSEVTEGLIVSVFPNGNVEIERWDTYRDEEILPRWTVGAPHDGSKFAYKDRDGLPAPAFEPGAALTVTPDGNACEITLPQASDNEVVFKYCVDFLENGQAVYSYSFFSQFYHNSDMPKQLTRRLSGLPYGKTLTVRVTAVDSYGNRSEPLAGEAFTVPPYRLDAAASLPVASRKDDLKNCLEAFSFETRFTAGSERKVISPFGTLEDGGTGFEQTPDGQILFRVRIGGRNKSVQCPVILRAGQAYHAVCTYEKAAGKLALYVNGALVGEENVGDGDAPAFTDGKPAFPPDGETEWLRVYDRALTQGEIGLLYQPYAAAAEVEK